MAGGGVDVSCVQQPRRGERRGRRQKVDSLPLDVIAEIAARSDLATLVRFAATCRDARRRIVQDPSLLAHLRLRDTDRFVLPLLRGHLMGITTYYRVDMYVVDTTAADATRIVKATFAEVDETLWNVEPLDSRGGLVLVRNNTNQRQLLVCNLATRSFLALPLEPALPNTSPSRDVQYVLLIGGSNGEGADDPTAVGRHFQVLKAKLVLSEYRIYRRLLVHIFSSEHGAWSPHIEIPISRVHGSSGGERWSRPLVIGDAIHWLCLTDSGSYMLMLHVGTTRVKVMSLPASFPGMVKNMYNEGYQYLLATSMAGGNPVVLVANTHNISAWEQSKRTKRWKSRPRVLIENEMILGFKDDGLAELVEKQRSLGLKQVPELLWFGERSGTVLLRIQYYLLWLDLYSKKIVRCFFLDSQMHWAQVYCPYEVDFSSWVPTFSSAVAL